MATLDSILKTAHKELGYAEEPVNRTKYGAFFKSNPAQWCGLFIMWVFAQNNHRFPNTAYTPNGVKAWKSRGAWHKAGPVQPGDVVYFDFPDDGLSRVSHVGLAIHQFENGDVLCIEGNTTGNILKASDERNGGEVALKRRPTKFIVGWGRPQYKAAPFTYDHVILKEWREQQHPASKPAKKTTKKAKTDVTAE